MMRFGSGTYNVRESEVVRDVGRMAQRSLVCTVHLLDGSQEDFELDKQARGQELLDRVYEHLELIEKDYFGLQYTDLVPEPDNMRWLEPSKSIRRQMQCPPYVLYFRVKFYVSDPSKLQEEYTRYHFYLQIRQDIMCGRLVCPESSAALLGSYAVQSEFGDYCEEEHGDNYLDAFQFLRNQTTSLIKKIIDLHKLHKGQTPADAEFNFLDHAKRLDMYGVDLYHARDSNLAEIQLGVTSYGVVVFQQSMKINTFSWPKILKISFKRKQFFIQLKGDEEDGVETVVGFNMSSTQASKMLWKSCIEHHTFFRLIAPPQVQPKGLFSLGSRYRYSGRTEYQTLEDMKRKARIERKFHRTGSRCSYARSSISASSRPGTFAPDNRFRSSMASGSGRDSYAASSTMITTTFGPNGPVTSAIAGTSIASENSATSNCVFNGIYPRNSAASSSTVSSQQQPPPSYHQHHQSQSGSQAQLPSSSVGNGQSNTMVENGNEPGYRLLPSSPTANRPSYPSTKQPVNVSSGGSSRASQTSNKQTNGRETTFSSTVITANILDVVDDVLVGEQSFEFPQDPNTAQAKQSPHTKSNTQLRSQNNMAYTSVQTPHSNYQISRLSNGRATVTGNMVKHTPGSAPPPAYSSSVSPMTNDHRVTTGHSANPGTSNGTNTTSQRNSTASRNSTTSNHGSSPQHRLSNTTNYNGDKNGPVNGHHNYGHSNGHKNENGDNSTALVTIRMKPDSLGRFGFNVKGGADQDYPIIVSRVIPSSPADTSIPRLNEGDQVLVINGRDVIAYTHDQVVRFIRSCREASNGELVLVVRPNAYIGEEVDEPDFQYVPQTPRVSECVPRSDKLQQSVLLLADSLASGSAIAQFEQLYRKKPGLTLDMAKTAENINKNRYRDIFPYDSTRVVIRNTSDTCGDYINASFVNMEIPTSGVVNRYIAAQGPLPHTSVDFWQMVWEQLCPVVVMLTTAVERGRVKCHQYWPRLYESQDYGRLQISCLREKETAVGWTREFSLVNQEAKEERLVTQLQYVAWPDHGVPDEPKEFIDFVSHVRQLRAGMVEPMVVHCSAGIGRTGVLILMETAMCLIEANEPVYPLDLVRTMRDQRAMLIQTASQYKFVCEAIVKVFNESIVKPLAEYQHQQR